MCLPDMVIDKSIHPKKHAYGYRHVVVCWWFDIDGLVQKDVTPVH